jgi:hypothetical protein
MSDPAAIAAKVKAAGGPPIDPTKATGKATADGVTIGWSTREGEIVITVIRKPWIASYSSIWSHIGSVLGESCQPA